MNTKEQYRFRRANNLCVTCGDETSGSARCEWCKRKARIYQADYVRKHKPSGFLIIEKEYTRG